MGHKRISNKRMKQMMEDILPEEMKHQKDDSLVEGKSQSKSDDGALELNDQQK
ncbi:hypothetical protein [Enterovibrio baiacu]|uniref:hypothetical protein n=1 Tax=Enterovibrio baiacu TaxID=2491023 RepID=UPI00142D74EC|nr:hypothetical protein [Enterovibrio baiacu]